MTFQPRYVIQKAPGIGGSPIAEDEPCLIIRGQDILAIPMMNEYIRRYGEFQDADIEVWAELFEHRRALILWQQTHGKKVADR
jgi:hypothetical protein